MGRYLEIARRVIEEQDRRKVAQAIAPETAPTGLPVGDPYAERMQEALRKINLPDYPAGMVPWLAMACPDLYAELSLHLVDEIQRLWGERAPLEQFDTVLERLVCLHRQCCDLYRASQTRDFRERR